MCSTRVRSSIITRRIRKTRRGPRPPNRTSRGFSDPQTIHQRRAPTGLREAAASSSRWTLPEWSLRVGSLEVRVTANWTTVAVARRGGCGSILLATKRGVASPANIRCRPIGEWARSNPHFPLSYTPTICHRRTMRRAAILADLAPADLMAVGRVRNVQSCKPCQLVHLRTPERTA